MCHWGYCVSGGLCDALECSVSPAEEAVRSAKRYGYYAHLGLLEMMPDKIISQEKAIIDILDQK